MKLVVCVPYILAEGIIERMVLETCKKYNPVIYASIYKKDKTYKEFSEFDVQILKNPVIEAPLSLLGQGPIREHASAGLNFLAYKIKEDYDVINAYSPAHWIRNRNPRVCCFFTSPYRTAFDLYDEKVRPLPMPKRLVMDAALTAYRNVEKYIYPKIEKTVSGSPYTNVRDAKFISEYIQKPLDTIAVPGVDEKEFQNSGYGKYFFYASRFSQEKRFEYVIEAFRKFSQRKNGWKLVLAGYVLNREKNEYVEKLKALSAGLDVEFKFSIPKEELRSLLSGAHAFLFAGVREDWGVAVIEAMASEKPVISVNEGGPAYSILDGKTGFLVNSPDEMSERMVYLAERPDENEKMGKAARKRVIENYTLKIFLDRMGKAFDEVAAAKGK